MEFFTNILVSLFLLSCFLLPYAQGLQCHVCNTANKDQQDCDKIPEGNTKYLRECETNGNQSCRIQTQYVDYKVLDQDHGSRTIRQCASVPYNPNKPCYYKSGFGGKVTVCHCDGDGCNEATSSVASLAAVVLSFILTLRVL